MAGEGLQSGAQGVVGQRDLHEPLHGSPQCRLPIRSVHVPPPVSAVQ